MSVSPRPSVSMSRPVHESHRPSVISKSVHEGHRPSVIFQQVYEGHRGSRPSVMTRPGQLQQQQQGQGHGRQSVTVRTQGQLQSVTIVNSLDQLRRHLHPQLYPQHYPSVTEDGRRVSSIRRPSVIQQLPEQGGASRRTSRYHRPSVTGSSYHSSSTGVPVGRDTAYENTYHLGPHEWERFSPCRAQAIIEQVLQSYLDGEMYDASKCALMSKHLSDIIKERIKSDLNYPPTEIIDKAPKMRSDDGQLICYIQPRYRIICTVLIGQMTGQSVRVASRCVWDAATDNSVSASYQNNSLFSTAVVFAVYYE